MIGNSATIVTVQSIFYSFSFLYIFYPRKGCCMNVRYIVDFVDGGDTYGLSKILKGDSVEIYYDRTKMTNISLPELLSIFVAKDAGAITNLKIRPYSEDELKSKQEFLTFIVARASAHNNVTVISRTFKMSFPVTGVRVISTMEKLYKGADPYFFSYSGTNRPDDIVLLKEEISQPVEEPAPKPEPKPQPQVVKIPKTAQPEKKVLAIKREEPAEIPDSKLAEEIVKCMHRNGISQALFSELCEVNPSTVSQFIRGVASASDISKNKFRKTIKELNEMAPVAKAK